MLSWKLRKSLDDEKHQLFYNQVQTYYEIEGYSCACGHEEILVRSPYQEDYQCPMCQNTHFYDANLAHNAFDNFCFLNRKIALEYSFNVKSYEDRIVSSYQTAISIPKVIDFTKNKITSEPIELFSFTLYQNAIQKIDHCISFNYGLLYDLKENLDCYINTNQHLFDVPSLGVKRHLTRNILSLFWAHPWLKEGDFHLWEDVGQLPKSDQTIESALLYILKNRNEKSIKKALYENYLHQIKEYACFKTTLINPIIATISDANLVVQLLSHHLNRKEIILQEEPYITQFILFLKQYYTEKQIVRVIQQIEDGYYFSDLLRDFIYVQDALQSLFQKPKCSLSAIHDEIVRCSQIKRYNDLSNKQIYYTFGQEKACVRIMEYDVRLPESGEELYTWAEDLHNCLSGYFEMIYDNQTTVYGFFYEGKIEFAAEVADKTIYQASAIGNSSLDELQNEVLTTWFHRYIMNKDTPTLV